MSDAPAPTRAEEGRERREALKAAFDWLQVYGLDVSSQRDGDHPKLDTLAREFESFGRHAAAQAEAEVARLREEIAGWQRIAVIAAIPLEAMRAAGSYRALSPETQTSVDEAVVAIRMAVSGEWLPPYGDINTILAPVRTALETPHADN